MPPPARRIGILAGGGTLPLEFARSAAARGELVHIVALEGAADTDFGSLPVTRIGMGQVGRMLRAFTAAGARDIVIIGPARRPDLLRIRPDTGFFLSLPAILKILASGGDDGVLRGVVRFFEAKGFRVLGPADVAPETLVPLCPLTPLIPAAADAADFGLGFEIIRVLGDFDVGQAVIVRDGRIEAIEGAEGTDGMLMRYTTRRGAGAGRTTPRSGILVKRPKPGQELRVDMPSIGPGTVTRAAEAGLKGIAVLAGGVLVAERAEVVRRARDAGLFVVGADDSPATVRPARDGAALLLSPLAVLGRRRPSDKERADLASAEHVMAAAARYECGRAVVVAKGHVLAVEAGGEGIEAVLARVEQLRNRAGSRRRKQQGVAVIAAGVPMGNSVVAQAARAGLGGLALCGVQAGQQVSPAVIAACDDAGMFLSGCLAGRSTRSVEVA